jgi:DNA repair protein RadB
LACLSVLRKIPTGCEAIDKILMGGVPLESVSLIYGEAETGKTTLAMQLMVNCADQGLKTLLVDCDSTFSARRLSQIAKNFKEIADLIICMRPENFHEQTVVIDRLSDFLTKNYGLVVVDTITSLYRVRVAETPEKTFELNRDLNRQIALLAQIAKTQKVAVTITSQVRSVLDETYLSIEPVATRVLRFWADTIIAMRHTENPQKIKAILEKAPKDTKMFQPLTSYLKIEETGIHCI